MAASSIKPEALVEDLVRLQRVNERAPGLASEVDPVIAHLHDAAPEALAGSAAGRLLGVSHTVVSRWLREGELVPGPKGSDVALDDLVDLVGRLRDADGAARHPLASTLRARVTPQARRTAAAAGVTPATLLAWTRGGLLGSTPTRDALELPATESAWLVRHAKTARELHRMAREDDIDVLVLFGSTARGDDDEASDVDLVADGPAIDDLRRRRRLVSRLSERLEREVELIPLDQLVFTPHVLVDAMRGARIVADRAGRWAELHDHRRALEAAAAAEIATHGPRWRAAMDSLHASAS